MTEIELKLLLDAAAGDRLKSHEGLRRMTRGEPERRELLTIYHDTGDWALRKRGIALRLRRAGDRWVQTIKIGRSMTGGLSRTREIETELASGELDLSAIPDAEAQDRILGILDGRSPREVARTEIRRTVRMLEPEGSLIEFALDEGEVIAGSRRAELREAELELIEGEPAALFSAAARIFDRGFLRFSDVSKAERGYRLATEGRIDPRAAVRKARGPAIAADASAQAAMQALLAECLEQITANARVVLESEESEGPHQLRIGLRRLRAALRLPPSDVLPGRYRFLAERAQALGRAASAVRDIDVLCEDVIGPRAAALPGPGRAALMAALTKRRAAARRALRTALTDEDAPRFLLELSAAASGLAVRRTDDLGDWRERPARALMADALDRAWKRTRRRARGIATLDVEARHELRKALKTLRYTTEFAAPLHGGKATRRFLKRLKALQDVFGSLNDAAMAEAMLQDGDPPAADDPEARFVSGLLLGSIGAAAERDWQSARGAWKTLKAEGPFWRG